VTIAQKPFRYASVCDGIGAVHEAWKPLGWQCAWTSEIELFPAAVVEHHHGFPNVGDMLKITEETLEQFPAIDLLVGGTPCQSFSVAGLRGGLADPRGNLALRFLQLVGLKRPKWVVWENVPGVISSWSDEEVRSPSQESIGLIEELRRAVRDELGEFVAGGISPEDFEEADQSNDLDTFTSGLAQLGYGWAMRVLDAQYFGVPQRRRRVLVVGCLSGWQRAAAVLFERHCLSGNPPPCREAGKGVAGSIAPSIRSSGPGLQRTGDSRGQDCVIPINAGGSSMREVPQCGRCLNAGGQGRQDFETETLIPVSGGFFDEPTHALRADGFDASEDGTGRGTPLVPVVGTLCNSGRAAGSATQQDAETGLLIPVAIQEDNQNGVTMRNTVGSLRADAPGTQPGGSLIAFTCGVRRLMPVEAERLQGFPDGYTAITFRGKPAADDPRYRAIGNSMAVPVMRWIGRRIQLVSQIASSDPEPPA
jgi:DNA (cytosine-5)-methyltransferase 1